MYFLDKKIEGQHLQFLGWLWSSGSIRKATTPGEQFSQGVVLQIGKKKILKPEIHAMKVNESGWDYLGPASPGVLWVWLHIMFYFSKVLGEAKLKTCFCIVITHFSLKSMCISRGADYPGPVSYFGGCPSYECVQTGQATAHRGSQRPGLACWEQAHRKWVALPWPLCTESGQLLGLEQETEDNKWGTCCASLCSWCWAPPHP